MPQPTPEPVDPIDPEALVRSGMLAACEHLAEVGSTMDRARVLAATTRPLPVAVVADRQTAGRGRRGAGWWQPPGSLVCSLVVAAAAGGGPQPLWSLAAGVALAETLRGLVPGLPAVVRWPNDVEVHGRKLAGILVETAGSDRAIFGIGVNTTGRAAAAPAPLRERVTTIPDCGAGPLPRQQLLAALVPRLFDLLAAIAADPAILAERYRPLCGLTGRFVRVHVGAAVVAGTCRGIGADGTLVVETEAGPTRLASGSLTAPHDVWRGGG